MDIKRNLRYLADSGDEGWTDTKIRNEVAIHHVEMQHIGTRSNYPFDLFTETTEVGSE
jgi:hypothetical protein